MHTVARVASSVVPYIAKLHTYGRYRHSMVFILIQYRLFRIVCSSHNTFPSLVAGVVLPRHSPGSNTVSSTIVACQPGMCLLPLTSDRCGSSVLAPTCQLELHHKLHLEEQLTSFAGSLAQQWSSVLVQFRQPPLRLEPSQCVPVTQAH